MTDESDLLAVRQETGSKLKQSKRERDLFKRYSDTFTTNDTVRCLALTFWIVAANFSVEDLVWGKRNAA